MPATRRLRNRTELTAQHSAAPNSASRPRRAAASGTTIERSSPDEVRGASIRLTVKSDPKKLQQATRGPTTSRTGRNVILPDLADIVSGPRQGRKKAIVEESSEDEDDEDDQETPAGYGDEDEEEVSEDEDAEGEEDEDEDMDAEGEEDEEMIDAPPVRASAPKGKAAKPQVTVTPAQELPSVEDKEMAMDDDDDDELSSLEDEDAEGELDDEIGEEDAEGEEDEDSEEDISASASRGDTPDLSKLTRRQRGQFEDVDGSLLALSNGMISNNHHPYAIANILYRSTKEETSHSRRTRHAPRRNGPSSKEPERKAQRGGKNGHHKPSSQKAST
jgi:Ino eighty subunit 2